MQFHVEQNDRYLVSITISRFWFVNERERQSRHCFQTILFAFLIKNTFRMHLIENKNLFTIGRFKPLTRENIAA
jgi:hypothetical protein